MSEQFTRWDSAEYLKTEADMAEYLDACIEEAGDDPAFIARALGAIARARGMTQVAKDAGLSRESLYRALSGDGNPEFSTILKVVKALGLKLHVAAA
ncbi:addiction module antidote protein [Photorhabdus bodei]|uniref:Addiction module antidote protein n=1 Tax=Photorhabdus bodei TaxID=2029681 RepID=A0AAW6BDU4_9GAMM|nr:addiction module antidote protein [Photorhabdus bodei]MDB6370826.1 putative addiction module antidote protein [Photorhabdus bodei]